MKTKSLIVVSVIVGLLAVVNNVVACGGGGPYYPTAHITANPTSVIVNGTVSFDGTSSAGSGTIIEYRWDFGDGSDYAYGVRVSHSYADPCESYIVELRVTNSYSLSDTETCEISIKPVYYVSPEGSNYNDGLSWPAAFATIQHAIDAAVDGSIVMVAEGTYTGTGNRDIDFNSKAIAVQSTDPNDPAIVAATIINCQASISDKHRGFYLHSGEGNDSVISGLTIKNGYHYYGGGIYCIGASPEVTNCVIIDNSAFSGGGIYCNNGGSPTIINCIFSGNVADDGDSDGVGGALFLGNGIGLTVANCVFTDNFAADKGGAIYTGNCSLAMTNCSITDNYACFGEGLYNHASACAITNCIIWNGYYSIESDGLGEVSDSNLVGWWKFDGNANDSSGHGYNGTVNNATLTNGCFGNPNSAYYFNGSNAYIGLGNPAGLNFTGAITMAAWVRPDVILGVDINRNILVHGYSSGYPEKEVYLRTANNGQYEVGSYIQDSGDTGRAEYVIPLTDQGTWVHLVGLYDGTFWRLYRNGVEVASRQRTVGAIQVDWDWAIGARAGGSRFFTGAIDDVRIYNRALSESEVRSLANYICSSDIEGCGGSGGGWDPNFGIDGGGNIDTDPCFVNIDDVDGPDDIFGTIDDGLRLKADSNCIDTANGSAAPLTDILDFERIDINDVNNTGTGEPNYADMGAHEFVTVWFVDKDAGGSGDGNSWTDAFTSIGAAINAGADDSQIWVAEGTYGLTSAIDVNKAVMIYGGFEGTEYHKNARQPSNNPAVIDGNNGNFACFNLVADAIIDGFTITNGRTGVSCNEESSPTITNCVITGNTDGIVCSPATSPVIEKNKIYDNSDGGVWSLMAQPEIRNNCLYSNRAGIMYLGNTEELIANNTIVNNTCYGISSFGCEEPNVTSCILWNNGDDLNDCSATYSCIKDGDAGTGNIFYYPYFADAGNGDFHLLSYSPCIDAGNPSSSYSQEPAPNGSRINMGAYGNTAEATSKSINTDGDSLPDDWEQEYLGTLSQGSGSSTDNDDLTNLQEYRLGTRPDSNDTDGDGMPDDWEVDNDLDPLNSGDGGLDSDGDGKTNLQEYQSGSDPQASNIVSVTPGGVTIQAAINSCTHDWDVVVIAQGTYTGSNNCNLDFGGKKITIRSTDPNDPDVVANTIIDCKGTQSDPNRGFYFHNSEGPESVVSGLTIINGYGLEEGSDQVGGAIFCDGGSPTIRNCIFIHNTATYGGAIYNSSSIPTIMNCSFIENYSFSGGGGIYNENSNPTLINCEFSENIADSNGGAVYNDSASSPILTNCTIVDNIAGGLGGGISGETGSEPLLTNCILWGNSDGGDIYLPEEKFETPCANPFTDDYTDWEIVDDGTTSGPSVWKVEDNVLKQTSAINDGTTGYSRLGTYAYYEPGESWTNYKISMMIRTESTATGAIGVMFRYYYDWDDEDWNYYRFSWDRANNYCRLVKKTGDDFTLLAEDQSAYVQNQWYQIDIVADGSSLQVFIDGSLVLAATDTDNPFLTGTIAFYAWNNAGARFDNVVVSHPLRTGDGELAQIDGGSPDVMYSCIQDFNPDDAYIPFDGQVNGNIDDDPEFESWVSDSGLVSYWKLDDNAANTTVTDSQGTQNGVATANTSVLHATGKLGGAFDFDNQYAVEIADNDAYSFGNGTDDAPFSIAAWVYADPDWSGQGILTKYDEDLSKEWRFYLTSGNDVELQLYDNSSGGAVGAQTDTKLTAGWHFVVGTYDGRGTAAVGNLAKNGINIYVDGSLQSVARYNIADKTYTAMENMATKVVIGGWLNSGVIDNLWNDKIDNVMIFNKELSSDEISTIYNTVAMIRALYGNRQLSLTSRCIDSGDNDSVAADVSEDATGNDRFLDGDNDEIATVDMGAYEFNFENWEPLVSFFKFDENAGNTANDSAGGNNGTINGASWTTGVRGSALNFDGINDYLDIGTPANLSNIVSNFTVSFWAYPAATHEIDTESTTGTQGTSGQKYAIGPANGTTFWGSGHAGAGVSIGSNGVSVYEHAANYMPALLVWQGALAEFNHIAVVYIQNKPHLYVNGELKKIGQQSSCIVHALPRHIGAYTSYGYFNGKIDHIMFINKALTAGEIAVLASNHPPVFESIGNKTVAEEHELTFTLRASDADGDAITYSAANLPEGAILDGDIFSWTPSSSQDGNHPVTFTASDGKTQDDETITISVVEEGLAGYWNFDEGGFDVARDLSENGNDGTLVGMPWTNGRIGGAFDFDGQYAIEIEDNDVFSFGDGSHDSAFSIVAWVNSNDITANQDILSKVDFKTGVEKREWGFYINNSRLYFNMYDESGNDYIMLYSDSTLSSSTWHFVVATYDGFGGDDARLFPHTKLYIDNEYAPSYRNYSYGYVAMENTATKVVIGASYNLSGSLDYYFKGKIDDAMIFDRELSSSEISTIYNNVITGYDSLTGIQEQDYPVSYWKLDDLWGDTASDSTGGHNGNVTDNTGSWVWEQGEVEGALNFAGDSDYVALGNMNDAYYSVSFWAKFAQDGYYERIVDFGVAGGCNSQFIVCRNGSDSRLYYRNGIESHAVVSDYGLIINGEWHYYAIVQVINGSSNQVIFYRDGVRYGAIATGYDTPSSYERTSCYIGKSNWAGSPCFTGLLDELRIYTRSLSDTEVEELATNKHHPALVPIGGKSVYESDLLSFSISAFDADGTDLLYSATDLPSGAVFNGQTFSWIPGTSQQGTHNVTFTVSDGEFEDSETIQITVNDFAGNPPGASKAVSGALGNDLSLQVDPFTGSANYSIPIAVAPARQGTEPAVSLNYVGGGNGWCGAGWSLGMGAIQRNTKKGVPVKWNGVNDANEYDDNKGFVVSFSTVNSRLVKIGATDEYRAETDQAFLKYMFDKAHNRWVVTDKSGNKFYFGEVTGEGTEPQGYVGICMRHPDFSSATQGKDTFLWALAKIVDISGNTTYFDYTEDDGQIYLEQIRYNGNINSPQKSATHTVEFVLEDRPDKSISFASGYRIETKKRLSDILVKVSDNQVRRYKLAYDTSPTSKRSLLGSVTVFGNDDKTSLPPVTFEYQTNPFEFGQVQDWGPIDNQGYTDNTAGSNGRRWNSPSLTLSADNDTITDLLDINGDGLPDRVMRKKSSPYTVFKVQLNTGDGFEVDSSGNPVTRDWGPVQAQGRTDAEWWSIQGIDGTQDAVVMLFDINGDGLPDRVMRNYVTIDYQSPRNVFKVQLNTGFGFETQVREWTNVNNQGKNSSTNTDWNSPHASDGDSTHVTMCDINGDGLPDRVMRKEASPWDSYLLVQLNNGTTGFSATTILWDPLDAQGTADATWNSPNARNSDDVIISLMDINGDGLPDRVMRKRTASFNVFKVQYNTGSGFTPTAEDWGPLYTQNHDGVDEWGSLQGISSEDAFVMLFDISADGLPDRVMRNDVGTYAYPENVFKVQLNTGTGFELAGRIWKGIDSQGQTDAAWNSPYADDGDGSHVMLCDINGDGLPDRVMRNNLATGSTYAPPNNVFKVQLSHGQVPDLLKKVTGKIGGSVEVTYTPSTQYDNTDHNGKNMLPFAAQTVSAVTVDDGLGNESTTTYDYSRGRFDFDRREFCGFGRVEVTDPCGARSVTYYHQGGGFDDSENGEFEDEGKFVKKGMPYRVELYGSDGKLYTRTINKVVQGSPGTGRYFAYVVQTISMDYEGLSNYRAKATQSEYNTSTGNITKVIDLGEVGSVNIATHQFTDITVQPDGQPDYPLYTHTAYETFALDPNITGKVERVWTSEDSDGNDKLSETQFTYDTAAGHLGQLLVQESWLKEESRYVSKQYEYDDYGNQDKITDEVGLVTEITYDDDYAMFPVTKTTGTFETTATYDVNSGLPVTTTDFMGITTLNVYDEFYRLTDVYTATEPQGDPDLWLTRIEYCLGGIVDGNEPKNFIRQRFNGFESFTYNDGFGRPIQSRTKAETSAAGEFRVADNCYNERGAVKFATKPFFSNGCDFTLWDDNHIGVLTEYDAIGRVYKVTPSADDVGSPMGPAMAEYKDGTDQWGQVAIDPEGKTTKRYVNAKGDVIKLVEVTGSGDIETTYYYDQLRRLTDTIDSNDNTISATYDSLGRKTQTEDPDMGTWSYEYDDAGKLTEQTDSRGNTVKLFYNDQLDRLTTKEIYNSTPTLVETITYTYDTNEPGYNVYKGLLFKVEDANGWVKNSYDACGRAVKATRYINANSTGYTTQTSYDDADRVTEIIYPGSLATIVYDYGTAGELLRARSTDGTAGDETFYESKGYDEDGKVIGVNYGNGIDTDYEYYTNSGRIKRIHTYKPATNMMDLTYTFDKVANIKSVTDSVYEGYASGGIQNIQYDDLYRLASLYSVGQGKTITYSYDALGNIVTNGDYGTGTYNYKEGGSTKPHAVTSVTDGKTYTYDNCGNMTARGSQNLSYNAQNRLTKVVTDGNTVTYGYAYDGSRLWKKVNGTVRQVWVGGIYEEKYDASQDKDLILCHIYAGGDLVATFEPASTWSQLINRYPYLAGVDKAIAVLFKGGRTPITGLSLGMLTGLAMGVYYTRRRLSRYGLAGASRWDNFYMRNPWREMLLLMMMAAIIITSFPQEAYASNPPYYPVFYYYHSDHLGSATVMTNREGNFIQHYGYTAFGNERYKNNAQAFSVTNRYTGQQIDEDTGLYFYGSRYYDPQLGRFIQADTIVPSANTSQALNRYTYVNNNPLKFTDPLGHSWLSKTWKKFTHSLGKIFGKQFGNVLIAIGNLIGGVFNPYGLLLITAGTAYNVFCVQGSSSFGDFFKQLGYNYAASATGQVIGSYFGSPDLPTSWGEIPGFVVHGAVVGAVSGAASSAIYGQNVGKGAYQGAAWGAALSVPLGYASAYVQEQINAILQNHPNWERFVSKFTNATWTDQANEYGILGIHSQSHGPDDTGHSWMTYTAPSGDTVSLALYHNTRRDLGTGLLEGTDITINNDPSFSTWGANRYHVLSAKEANRLVKWIGHNPLGMRHRYIWMIAPTNNCSSWASSTWTYVTGERLMADDWSSWWKAGIETPWRLQNSIRIREAESPSVPPK